MTINSGRSVVSDSVCKLPLVVCFANSQNKLMYRPLSGVKATKPPILENSEDPHEYDANRDHPFAYIPISRTL
jgi:hypothetical protein